MTADDRVKAVVEFGFTERQARFLVTVMLHSGVCLLRQYTAFAGIVHGQKTRKFFAKLVRRKYATAYPCRHNRGRVYHVHHKPLYRAIGQPSSMDVDRAHIRVFIGCRSGVLTIVDGTTGRIVATQPIGPGVDALEFDTTKGLVFVSTGGNSGVLSVFHQGGPDQYALVQNIKTLPGARTMALDSKTGMVYLPAADVGAPPAPTAQNPRPRGRILPGTFSVLVVGR
jgi:hypothetical protein